MEQFVVCGYCGEKNSPNSSKCRKCHGLLPLRSSSTTWKHVYDESLKRCKSCNARIKSGARYCSKCGQKQPQETESLSQPQQKIQIEFTKERASLKRAIQIFDKIFIDQNIHSTATQDLLYIQKKNLYFNQKERFLQRNISNEMFYNHLKSLEEYLESIAMIPEIREELESATKELNKVNNVRKFKTEVKTLPSFSPKQEEVKIQPNYLQELELSKKPLKPATKERQILFSSIQYQVRDLIFEEEVEETVVRLIPYSGTIKEIKITFHQNQIMMVGCLKKSNLPLVNIEIKREGEPRQPSWDDPWHDITLVGEENILKKIKMHSEIADWFNSLGEVRVKVESQSNGELCLQLICNETNEAIKTAYSLIKDLQLFFEILFY